MRVNDVNYDDFVDNYLLLSESEDEMDASVDVDDPDTSSNTSESEDDIGLPAPAPSARAVPWQWNYSTNKVTKIPFTGNSGLNAALDRRLGENCSELDVFTEFLPDDFWQLVVNETNRYASSKPNKPTSWRDVTLDEMKLYISLCILMSQHKKSNINDYWTTRRVIASPIFGQTMPRDRFKIISRYLHFSNLEQPNDKLKKIRNIIEYLLHKFKLCFTPGKEIAVDESLMAFRGRLSFIQFNPSKRARFGIKIYKLCDSKTGYCHKFKIYVGRENDAPTNVTGMSISEQVILDMSSDLLNEGRIIFMDNWYSSPLLYEKLLGHKTYAVGTVRSNRKNFPKEVAQQKLSKGELTFMASKNILAVKWQDRKPVTMLSTYHECPDYVEVTSQRGKKSLKPNVVNEYNQSMCGVDKEDEKLSSFPIMRRYCKGYKKIFFYLMDVTIYNASVLHQIKTGKKQTMSEFRVNIAEQILLNVQMPVVGAVGRASSGDTPTRLQAKHWGHFIGKIPTTSKERNARRCRVCSANKKRSETVWWCKKCMVPLHLENCFEEYHTKIKF